MGDLRLALRLLWRDWRAGELTLLLTSLVIAIGTVTTITLFIDRLQQALVLESASLIAADRVVQSGEPVPREWLDKAAELGLRQSRQLGFLSMVFAGDRSQLASVKAVDDQYPLRGSLIIAGAPFGNGWKSVNGPAPGELWLESRLLPALDAAVGDSIELGAARLQVSKVLIKEPDRGGGFNDLGPRVLMNLADVEATEVVQPGSRITYRYLFSGDSSAIASYTDWLQPRMGPGIRLLGVKEGSEGVGRALEKAERFLLLGGLLGVVLAGVAIALAAQRYSVRHLDHVAILKSLGATSARVDRLYLTVFCVLGLIGTLLGCSLGFTAQAGAIELLAPFIPVLLPPAGLKPYLVGCATGILCLLAFALPPILRLRAIAPLRVLRRDLGQVAVRDRLPWLFGMAGTLVLMLWYSKDWRLTLMLFAGALVVVAVLGSLALLLLRSGRVLGMQAGSIWRLAMAGLQRRGRENVLQILVFGIAIMLLLILILVRTALIDEWRNQIPDGAPNHFLINIAPEELSPVGQMLKEVQSNPQPLYPMISGRIVSANGVSTEEIESRRQKESGGATGPGANSSRNLTWMTGLPEDNVILEGVWWPPDHRGEAQVSLEQDLARRNGFKVGDTLTFQIRDQQLSARVTSIRLVRWDTMRPNFYIIFSPGALDQFPATYMTGLYLERSEKLFLNRLLRAHPTITVLEVDALIEQVKTIIAQVTLAVEVVLALILVSGMLVLIACIQASMDERMQQQAIIRTLGASQKLVLGSLLVEFVVLGLFAGGLAALAAEVTVYGMETQLFQLDYAVNPWFWLMGPLIGALLIGAIGVWTTRRVVQIPPVAILRELA